MKKITLAILAALLIIGCNLNVTEPQQTSLNNPRIFIPSSSPAIVFSYPQALAGRKATSPNVTATVDYQFTVPNRELGDSAVVTTNGYPNTLIVVPGVTYQGSTYRSPFITRINSITYYDSGFPTRVVNRPPLNIVTKRWRLMPTVKNVVDEIFKRNNHTVITVGIPNKRVGIYVQMQTANQVMGSLVAGNGEYHRWLDYRPLHEPSNEFRPGKRNTLSPAAYGNSLFGYSLLIKISKRANELGITQGEFIEPPILSLVDSMLTGIYHYDSTAFADANNTLKNYISENTRIIDTLSVVPLKLK